MVSYSFLFREEITYDSLYIDGSDEYIYISIYGFAHNL